MGIEAILTREIKELGYTDVRTENGRVTYRGDFLTMARSNLWLRTADRIFIKMGEFKATSFEELFEHTKALPWSDLLPEDAHFPVEGRSVRSQLSSVPACQSIVKKAIVENLKSRYGIDQFPESSSTYTIEVSLLNDIATLTIDTSGPALHRRGYRKLSGPAPIKETLAAAMILISRWRPERPFADPCCGSGTIPIEAALIGRNIAPGLHREFASEKWSIVDPQIWKQARQEAHEKAQLNRKLVIYGSDIDEEAVTMARYHAQEAGVLDAIQFAISPAENVSYNEPYGCLVTNPPYGERIGDREEVEDLYSELGYIASEHDDWSFFVLTSHTGFERLFEKRADKRRKLYNGRIECQFYQYLGPLPPRNKESAQS